MQTVIIGCRIKAKRKVKKLTQQQLAQNSNLSLERLCRIEQGVKGIRFEELISIASVLGCRMGMLLSYPNRQNSSFKESLLFYRLFIVEVIKKCMHKLHRRNAA